MKMYLIMQNVSENNYIFITNSLSLSRDTAKTEAGAPLVSVMWRVSGWNGVCGHDMIIKEDFNIGPGFKASLWNGYEAAEGRSAVEELWPLPILSLWSLLDQELWDAKINIFGHE